jgi:predicted enzyme related to lactoylglutathione lyase
VKTQTNKKKEIRMTKRNIVHIEIPARNAGETAKFYAGLFGWKITPMPEMNYTLWEPAEGPGGGFSELSDFTKAGEVLIYVDSADIESDLKKAEALGGKIVMPKSEIPNTGWFGVFSDPTGNKIALYTNKNPEYNK